MQEGGRRPGRSKSGGNLATDVTGFAQAADNQLAFALDNQTDRPLEALAETVGKRIQRPSLVVEHIAAEAQQIDSRRV
jgi:enoyl-[acyl-carrier-protein] reductase (NADH)